MLKEPELLGRAMHSFSMESRPSRARSRERTTTERAPQLTTVPVQLANQFSNDDKRASQFKESFVYRPERNAIQQVEGKSAEAMPHLGPEARSPEH